MKRYKATLSVALGSLLIASSAHAAVLASGGGAIDNPAIWGGALPVLGNTDTYDQDGNGMTFDNSLDFHAGTFILNAQLAPTTNSNLAITFNDVVANTGARLYSPRSGTVTFNFDSLELNALNIGTNHVNKNVALNAGVWSGSGDIDFDTIGDFVLTSGNTMAGYTGTVNVTGAGIFVLQAATSGSFGLSVTNAGSQFNVDGATNYSFSDLTLGTDTIAGGTYAYGDFTVAQQAFLGDDAAWTGSITVVPEPSSAALLGLGGFALILRRRK